MSFVLKRLPLADQDAHDAAIWYEERQSRLGEDFLDEVDRAVRALAHDALLYRIRFADVRRAPVRRFRYQAPHVIHAEKFGCWRFSRPRHPRSLQQRVAQVSDFGRCRSRTSG